jgi:hypothetical protein
MIIERREDTGHGGRIDVLALAPRGARILIELKRAKTPREVVAQAFDYAGRAEFPDAEDPGAAAIVRSLIQWSAFVAEEARLSPDLSPKRTAIPLIGSFCAWYIGYCGTIKS